MKLLKYTMLIGAVCAAFTMQPVNASEIPFTSSLDTPNDKLSPFTGPYGTVTVSLNVATQVATFTFTSNSPSYSFIDNHIAAINVSTSFDNFTVIDDPFFTGTGSGQVDGMGTFDLFLINSDGFGSKIDSLSFSIHNTGTAWTGADQVLDFNSNGFDAAGHIAVNSTDGAVTGFAGEGPQGHVPDGGATATLLGLGLAGLAGIRARFGRKMIVG